MTEGTWDWICRAVGLAMAALCGFMAWNFWTDLGAILVPTFILGAGLFVVLALTYPRPLDPAKRINR